MHASQCFLSTTTTTDSTRSHSVLHRHSLPHSLSTISFRTHSSTPILRRLTIKSATSSTAVADGESKSKSNVLSFYQLLGISESDSLLEIKQAYKQLARKYHPDVSPPDQVKEYTQRFILVQEAYETLYDPRRRAMYDRDMARGVHLAFSARRRYSSDEDLEGQSGWRNQWKSQLLELKRRSSNSKEGSGDISWGARMRCQRS